MVYEILIYASVFVIGLALGILVYRLVLLKNKSTARQILENARHEAEKIKKERLFGFKVELQQRRTRFLTELKQKEEKYQRLESLLVKKEKDLRRDENQVKIRDARSEAREKKINELEELLYEKHKKVDNQLEKHNKHLERISSLSIEDAKKLLLQNLEERVKIESARLLNDIRQEVKEKAQKEAREIIAFAIENLAYEFTMESTLSTVELPNERYKGMIIGREGRNIKTFEEATGVKVIVDDTPELVVLSGYDPIAREVARISMQNLIKTKNINVQTIQQTVQKATQEVQRTIQKAAEETLRELKINDVHPQIREHLGRLKYRYSYGQNMLQHSKEVALLSGAMAAELGFNVRLARRAGLLHDIGKAVSNGSEGSHVTTGVELTTRCKEHEIVINAILAHHEEAEPIHPISVLVTAADRISGSRPGARRDTLEAYTKRISKLEEIANSFEGVAKTYAISAGREIRVIVEPDRINDAQASILSSDIANKIQETMEFPGRIKVCVIRQTIASRLTDDFDEADPVEENDNNPGR
jgi:ribonuclease Y